MRYAYLFLAGVVVGLLMRDDFLQQEITAKPTITDLNLIAYYPSSYR